MERYTFIYEHSLKHKLRVIGILFAVFIVVIGIIVSAILFTKGQSTNASIFHAVRSFIVYQMKNFTPLGIFYSGLAGSLFFSLFPLEALFYYALTKGNSYMLSLTLIMAGLIPAEIFNYIVGRKCSNIMRYLISLKKIYGAKRFVNRYGSYGVFFFNFVPFFPSPILTFALGIAKYNATRLFILLVLADVLKFVGIIILYHYIGTGLERFL